MVYVDFPKMERNGGRIMKFREGTALLVFWNLLLNSLLELCQVASCPMDQGVGQEFGFQPAAALGGVFYPLVLHIIPNIHGFTLNFLEMVTVVYRHIVLPSNTDVNGGNIVLSRLSFCKGSRF